MNYEEIKDLKKHIAQAEMIEKQSKYPDEKIIAGYLIKRLKNRLLNLMYPKPKEL